MTSQMHLSHILGECETRFSNAAWLLQATIWCRLLDQRKIATLLSGHPKCVTQLL